MIKVQLSKIVKAWVGLLNQPGFFFFFSLLGDTYTPLISEHENNSNDKLQLSDTGMHRQIRECFML